jgi:Asp/Glu/hydantoin racemase
MKVRIGVLHTVTFLADMFRALIKEHLPNIDQIHIVDEGIIRLLLDNGQLNPKITRRILWQALQVQDAGANLILFTCSSTSPAVDDLRKLVSVPIMKVDEAMANYAVECGERIGIIVTSHPTLQPSVNLIQSVAREKGRKVEVQSILETEAFTAKLKGDSNRHDLLVKEAVRNLAVRNDVVVLAQASMAHLTEALSAECSVPIISSPKHCIEALKQEVSKLV